MGSASLSLTIHLAPEMYNRLAERALAAGSTMEQMVAQAITQLLDDAPAGLKIRKVILPAK